MSCAGAASPRPPSPSIGNVMDKPVPETITSLPLENQAGRSLGLNQFRGKVVLLAPFLTSCQEECPITAGALLQLQRALMKSGLSKKVAIVEASVDPGRDTAERMAAYAQLTGSTWPLLTGSVATLAALWHFFGMYHQIVPEGSPPGIDWQTGRPYTYDVDHWDGFVLLGPNLHERFVAGGLTRIQHLPQNLQKLLDAEGKANLRSPGGGTWTVTNALDALRWVLAS
jgi:cytochrome oxidase Cu insertion factor (SCO1/SenC/PrrC family)